MLAGTGQGRRQKLREKLRLGKMYLALGAVLIQASKRVEVSGVQLGGVLEANQGTAHVVTRADC